MSHVRIRNLQSWTTRRGHFFFKTAFLFITSWKMLGVKSQRCESQIYCRVKKIQHCSGGRGMGQEKIFVRLFRFYDFKLLVSRREKVSQTLMIRILSLSLSLSLFLSFLSSRRNQSLDRGSWKRFSSKDAYQNCLCRTKTIINSIN